LAAGDAHIHFYGKQARPGRKIGHITAVGDSMDELHERVLAVSDALFEAGVAAGAREVKSHAS
jgi:5-(carboxyamino)imidazole ribonucleotide synthase